jgi:hypothetical protein
MFFFCQDFKIRGHIEYIYRQATIAVHAMNCMVMTITDLRLVFTRNCFAWLAV